MSISDLRSSAELVNLNDQLRYAVNNLQGCASQVKEIVEKIKAHPNYATDMGADDISYNDGIETIIDNTKDAIPALPDPLKIAEDVPAEPIS